jgi:tryptophan halogenase
MRSSDPSACDADFLGPFNYAYHFDAAQFAAMLRRHAISMGVRHVTANVERTSSTKRAIASVVTREAGSLSADLYMDCTGFRAALIEGAMKSPFRSMSDVLFADRAVAHAGALRPA